MLVAHRAQSLGLKSRTALLQLLSETTHTLNRSMETASLAHTLHLQLIGEDIIVCAHLSFINQPVVQILQSGHVRNDIRFVVLMITDEISVQVERLQRFESAQVIDL